MDVQLYSYIWLYIMIYYDIAMMISKLFCLTQSYASYGSTHSTSGWLVCLSYKDILCSLRGPTLAIDFCSKIIFGFLNF